MTYNAVILAERESLFELTFQTVKMLSMNKNLYAVILAGGSGTRLWPLSRKYSPKQLLKLVKGESLLDMTIRRASKYVPAENITIVSSAEIASEIRTAIQANLRKKVNFIDEPQAKDTATAIGVAAAYIANKNKNGIMAVLPSDHLIENEGNLEEIIDFAAIPAADGMLVTLGIAPGSPETGFGYIKPGEVLMGKNSFRANKVQQFFEKPDRKKAEELITQGCLWNSGMFIFKAKTLIDECIKYLPELGQALAKLADDYSPDNFENLYKLPGGTSIDKGVFEKADNVAVIPIELKWRDLGSLLAIEQLHDKDVNGNVIIGQSVDIDSKNTMIYGADRLIATIGLQDVAIVDTADVTLVCKKDRAQDIKQLVDMVQQRGGEEHLIHKTVERPWGSYTVMNQGPGFKVKRVEVHPGESLSLQFHRRRSEHWVLVSGKAKIVKEDETIYLHPGESTYIPTTMKHKLENPGPDELALIEVQIGEYLEEDDIVRIDDPYDR